MTIPHMGGTTESHISHTHAIDEYSASVGFANELDDVTSSAAKSELLLIGGNNIIYLTSFGNIVVIDLWVNVASVPAVARSLLARGMISHSGSFWDS